MRYSISGECTAGLDISATLTTELLVGATVNAGRFLYLRGLWAYCASAAQTIDLCDSTTDQGATGATRKFTLPCASGRTTVVDFPPPGMKFSTCPVVVRNASTCTGSFEQLNAGAPAVGAWGYEEG